MSLILILGLLFLLIGLNSLVKVKKLLSIEKKRNYKIRFCGDSKFYFMCYIRY
jgi:hypothetical protein